MKRYVLLMLFSLLGTIVFSSCSTSSNQEPELTRPPVSNITLTSLRSEECNLAVYGCTKEHNTQVYLSRIGTRVRWSGYVSFQPQDYPTALVISGTYLEGSVVLLNIPSSDRSKYYHQNITFEGTIVAHPYNVWALDDVEIVSDIPPPVPTLTPQPLTDYDLTIEVTEHRIFRNGYWATVEITNNSSKRVKVYLESYGLIENSSFGNSMRPVYASSPYAVSYVIDLNPGESDSTQWVYGDIQNGDVGGFSQLCFDLYATIPYGIKGEEIVASWKLEPDEACRN